MRDPFAKLIFSWADGMTWEMVSASHRAWLPQNDGFVMVCAPIENTHIWWLFMVDHHFSPLKCGPSLFGPFPCFEETLLICTWRNWGRIRSMSATRWRWNSCVGNMAAVHTLLLLSSRGLLGNSLLHWGFVSILAALAEQVWCRSRKDLQTEIDLEMSVPKGGRNNFKLMWWLFLKGSHGLYIDSGVSCWDGPSS